MHLFMLDWGTRWFMVRIPAHVLAHEVASEYYADDSLELDINSGNLILSFRSEEDGDWGDDEDWMSSLIALRTDLMKGDHRCLYLGWLRSIQGAVYEGEIREDDVEPPVPAGLRTLSQPLECFANFLGIDFDLIAAAAEQSQDSLLARVIENDVSHPEVALRQRVFSKIRGKYAATLSSTRVERPHRSLLARTQLRRIDKQ